MKKYTVFTKTNSKHVMVGVATVLAAALMTGCSSNTADVTEEVVEVATTADAVTEAVTEAEDTTTEIVADEDTLTTEESTEAIDEVTTEADTTEVKTTEAGATTEAKTTEAKTTEAKASGGSMAETKKSEATTEKSTNKATAQTTTQQATQPSTSSGGAQKATTTEKATTQATTEATTQHTHNYNQIVYGTRTVHHDAVTHTEQQTVMKTKWYNGIECTTCGKIFDAYEYSNYQAAYDVHGETCYGGYKTAQQQPHDVTTTETVTVVDKAAYDETEEYIVGYKCSCGAME